jgi:hypothetical protein
MIPNLHIYYTIIPHFLLQMITSIANTNAQHTIDAFEKQLI